MLVKLEHNFLKVFGRGGGTPAGSQSIEPYVECYVNTMKLAFT